MLSSGVLVGFYPRYLLVIHQVTSLVDFSSVGPVNNKITLYLVSATLRYSLKTWTLLLCENISRGNFDGKGMIYTTFLLNAESLRWQIPDDEYFSYSCFDSPMNL